MKKIIYGILIIIFFAVIGILRTNNESSVKQSTENIPIDSTIPITSSLSCDELITIVETERDKLNFNCKSDSDCVYGNNGWCGICINKNTSPEPLKKLFNIYNIGAKKDCFPQMECMRFECNKCVNNKCVKDYKKLDSNH